MANLKVKYLHHAVGHGVSRNVGDILELKAEEAQCLAAAGIVEILSTTKANKRKKSVSISAKNRKKR